MVTRSSRWKRDCSLFFESKHFMGTITSGSGSCSSNFIGVGFGVANSQVRDGRVAILEGIEVGTSVVISGQNKLYRGASIIVDNRVAF